MSKQEPHRYVLFFPEANVVHMAQHSVHMTVPKSVVDAGDDAVLAHCREVFETDPKHAKRRATTPAR